MQVRAWPWALQSWGRTAACSPSHVHLVPALQERHESRCWMVGMEEQRSATRWLRSSLSLTLWLALSVNVSRRASSQSPVGERNIWYRVHKIQSEEPELAVNKSFILHGKGGEKRWRSSGCIPTPKPSQLTLNATNIHLHRHHPDMHPFKHKENYLKVMCKRLQSRIRKS